MHLQYQDSVQQITCNLVPTSKDIEGPFYKDGAPFRDILAPEPNLFLTGRVYDTDGKVVPGAVLDIWHADTKGDYDNEGYTYRGKVKADGVGRYHLSTIVPGDYPISETEFRCAHLHVRVTAPGHKTLTTQLYFPDDKYNEVDHWFDPSRVIQHPDGLFNFVIETEA